MDFLQTKQVLRIGRDLWMTSATVVMVVLIILISSAHVNGHGRLIEPPSRSSMWRHGYSTPKNYHDNQLFCGGFTVQWLVNEGRCGVCGDPWDAEREHEIGGKYSTGIIVRRYHPGQKISVIVELTAVHRGYFEFRICPYSHPDTEVDQDCLDRRVLPLDDGSGFRYHVTDSTPALHQLVLILPPDLVCRRCLLQWKYHSGNNWGKDETSGESCLGCGPQEEFYGCSDVSIGSGSKEDEGKTENHQNQILNTEEHLRNEEYGTNGHHTLTDLMSIGEGRINPTTSLVSSLPQKETSSGPKQLLNAFNIVFGNSDGTLESSDGASQHLSHDDRNKEKEEEQKEEEKIRNRSLSSLLSSSFPNAIEPIIVEDINEQRLTDIVSDISPSPLNVISSSKNQQQQQPPAADHHRSSVSPAVVVSRNWTQVSLDGYLYNVSVIGDGHQRSWSKELPVTLDRSDIVRMGSGPIYVLPQWFLVKDNQLRRITLVEPKFIKRMRAMTADQRLTVSGKDQSSDRKRKYSQTVDSETRNDSEVTSHDVEDSDIATEKYTRKINSIKKMYLKHSVTAEEKGKKLEQDETYSEVHNTSYSSSSQVLSSSSAVTTEADAAAVTHSSLIPSHLYSPEDNRREDVTHHETAAEESDLHLTTATTQSPSMASTTNHFATLHRLLYGRLNKSYYQH